MFPRNVLSLTVTYNNCLSKQRKDKRKSFYPVARVVRILLPIDIDIANTSLIRPKLKLGGYLTFKLSFEFSFGHIQEKH